MLGLSASPLLPVSIALPFLFSPPATGCAHPFAPHALSTLKLGFGVGPGGKKKLLFTEQFLGAGCFYVVA